MAERPVCDTCGNFDVSAETTSAYWNSGTQEWEVAGVCDKGHYCDNCDGEVRLRWIETYDIELTRQEHDTVLAALRYWQRMEIPNIEIGTRRAPEEYAIADCHDHVLDSDEIDALCERINS